jgi:polyphenol oxidase
MGAVPATAQGVIFYRSPLLAAFPEIVHAFLTRREGASGGPYQGLNLSFSVGDRREAVAQNRRLAQQAFNLTSLASAAQVHGNSAALVTAATAATGTDLPPADILITAAPGVGLLIKQADCQAVLLYDPGRRVVANVHCGWRGQVQNVLAQAVRLLEDRCGVRPPDLYAAISPSLGPCCAEFRNFQQEFPAEMWPYQVRPDYFDLWRLSRDQLAAAGLEPAHIDVAGLCTRCRTAEFFSYRAEKITGRQGSVIALKP